MGDAMSEVTSHKPGTPSWADVSTTDIPAATAFYTALFGWTATQVMEPEAGGYTMLAKNGKLVAGMGPTQGQPTSWMSYVTVEDADAAARKVREAGGTVMMEPFAVMTAGRMAVCQDPTGAVFAIWQAQEHIGAQLVNEPGALCWTELQTRDVDKAKAFYNKVFGWGAETHTGDVPYTEWKLDGQSIGGMMPMGPQIPAQVPPHWVVYIGTADCDASTAKATELGGTVMVPPMDIQEGLRFSLITDPQGGMVGLLQMAGMTG
jgi:hypothetical protein